MTKQQTKAILFLMNEAKRNALGEDFAVRTGSTQFSYIARAMLSLYIEGIRFDLDQNKYVVEPDSDAEQFTRACGLFRWGSGVPAKVLPPSEFIGSV
jgi:hypothetical protein